jgi:dipeptidyl aminopeptidase/acylaminoacyl peptidase
VKKQLTKGAWLVRRVDRVDTTAKCVWFWAHGVRPEQDPYHLHYCRVNLDGTGLAVLTEGDGTHEVWISPDRAYFVDSYSRVDLPPVTELRRMTDGKLVLKLESADATELQKAGWRFPERFVAKGRDGKTDIYGIIFRPTNYDPKKKYPVVEHDYNAPTEFHVPKKFSALHDPIQTITELGFIGVVIDGMGTNWRSKAFHDVCWKNLADGGFPDRIEWLKAAGAKYPEMDLSRVGIFGGSAGGRNALRALIAHSDTYKVAVADSGNHDDRFHHAWYGELWMGLPVGPHYEEQSNITQAHKMKGKLFLIAGELDRNVDPALTLRTVDALIKADKDFDLLIVPGGAHCPAESPYASRRRMDFLVRHLHGVEPRAK